MEEAVCSVSWYCDRCGDIISPGEAIFYLRLMWSGEHPALCKSCVRAILEDLKRLEQSGRLEEDEASDDE